MLFSFGENGKLGKIDFSKLVDGLTKEDLGIQNSKFEASLFDMVDTDSQKGVLNQKELSVFWDKLKSLSGEDLNLSDEEIISKLKDNESLSVYQSNVTNEHLSIDAQKVKFKNFIKNIFSVYEKKTKNNSPKIDFKPELVDKHIGNSSFIRESEVMLSQASSIMEQVNPGVIGRQFEKYSEFHERENFMLILDFTRESNNLMKLAEEGELTKKEYYDRSKEHLKKQFIKFYTNYREFLKEALANKTDKTAEEIDLLNSLNGCFVNDKTIEEYFDTLISNVRLEDVKTVSNTLMQLDSQQALEFIKNCSDSIPSCLCKDGASSRSISAPFLTEGNLTEKISFEEVYFFEQGKEYNQKDFANYTLAQAKMNIVLSSHNTLESLRAGITELKNNKDLSLNEKTEVFNRLVNNVYAQFPEKMYEMLTEIIEENGLEGLEIRSTVVADENGVPINNEGKSQVEISFINPNSPEELINQGYDISASLQSSLADEKLIQIMDAFIQKQEDNHKNILQGRSLDSYINEYNIAQKKVFSDTRILEDKLVQNSEKIYHNCHTKVEKIKSEARDASLWGMALIAIGGLVCVVPIPGARVVGSVMVKTGNTMALGGMVVENAVNITEACTREKTSNDEINAALTKGAVTALGFVIGGAAGKLSDKAFVQVLGADLSKKLTSELAEGGIVSAAKYVVSNPKAFATLTKALGVKVGTDFSVSLIGDLALAGIFDTDENWEDMVRANLMGIMMSTGGDLKNVGDLAAVAVMKNADLIPAKANDVASKQNSPTANVELVDDLNLSARFVSDDLGMEFDTNNALVKNNYPNSESQQVKVESQEGGKVKKSLVEPGIHSPKNATLKDFDTLLPQMDNAKLSSSNSTLIKELPNPSDPNKPIMVLTNDGEAIVWDIAEQLRANALNIEENIVNHFINSGLASKETLSHRSKSVQSLHDKIKTYMLENPDKTVADAVRDVRDAVGVRTVNKSTNVHNHPEVIELLEKGDYKSAVSKAVELESEYVFNALKGVIDKMADGTAEFSLTRISNYMGEDGIPYFTERQLFDLQDYALSKGINLPVSSRVTDPSNRASSTEIYNNDGTTVVRKSGYTALQMNFVTKEGDVFEWQYRGDKLNSFGEGEHIPYDLRTGKDIIGQDVILTDLYEPIKKILTNKDIMPNDLYKEYNAYLTAHYKYLREVELGFVDPGYPPKLPKGIDERLRADNLILLHDIGEKLKKGSITLEDALSDYQNGLVRNNVDNVTDVSYKNHLDAIKKNADIDRYEALGRLDKKGYKWIDTELFVKTCMDSKGNIKNNLVALVEQYRTEGIDDRAIFNFISRFKDENGVISDDLFKNLNEFINIYSKNKNNCTGVLNLFSAISKKSGGAITSNKGIVELINLIQSKKINVTDLNLVQDITDFMVEKNILGDSSFMDLVHFGIELKNTKSQSVLLSKDFKEILNSLTNKDGKMSDNAMSLAITYSKANLLNEMMANFILDAKNPETGDVDKFTLDFINKITDDLKKSGYNNSGGVIQLLQGALTTIRRPEIVEINGNGVRMQVPNEEFVNTYLSLYKTLPQASIEINVAQKIRKTTLILDACKQNDKIDPQKLAVAKDLLKAKFSPESINEIIKRSTKKGVLDKNYLNAFIKNYLTLSFADKNNLIVIDLKLENGILRQTMAFNDGTIKIFDLDAYNVGSKNEYNLSNKNVLQKQSVMSYTKIKDAVRGKSTKTISKDGVLKSEVTILYDKNGNIIGSEYITRGNNGVIDVKFRDVDGNTHVLASSKKDADGNIIIEKEFPSLDGTVTRQSFKETPDGSTESLYIIKDANDNILLEENRTFTKISDTHFTSSFNGKSYDIQIDELKVLTVTDDAGYKVRFDLHALTNNKLKQFEEMIKQLPGHEFFNMAEVGLKSIDISQIKDNAYYNPSSNSINLGVLHKGISTFLHEFGHNKDWKLKTTEPLRKDKDLQKIYKQEQEAFIKEFPALQRGMISYFISLDNVDSRSNQGISETIAETNNILSTPYQAENLAFRKYYLQRYFPRTIAYIAKEMNPDIHYP